MQKTTAVPIYVNCTVPDTVQFTYCTLIKDLNPEGITSLSSIASC